MIKKILLTLALCLLFENGWAQTTQYFTITGYYSPLPDQEYYVTGSYESEIYLNGEGIAGADGTPVYPGMMAGPPSMAFGTKICVPGFGCGAKHDTGQAIVNQGDRDLATYDRLDLWMGYGDEGLARALAWGVKHVECEVYPTTSTKSEGVNFVSAPAIRRVFKDIETGVYKENLYEGDSGNSVKILQKGLKSYGVYKGSEDGDYDKSVKDAVFAFQKAENILDDPEHRGAGGFGPQTRAALNRVDEHVKIQERIEEKWEDFHFSSGGDRGDSSDEVYLLQEFLISLEYLNAYPTGYFGPLTEQALISFQLESGVIKSSQDLGAGNVGPQTQEKLNEFLSKRRENKKEEFVLAQSQRNSYEKLTFLAGDIDYSEILALK